jgi:hypothetical protein
MSAIIERDLGGWTQGTATISFYDTAPDVETLDTNFTLTDSTCAVIATARRISTRSAKR